MAADHRHVKPLQEQAALLREFDGVVHPLLVIALRVGELKVLSVVRPAPHQRDDVIPMKILPEPLPADRTATALELKNLGDVGFRPT